MTSQLDSSKEKEERLKKDNDVILRNQTLRYILKNIYFEVP